MNESRRVVPPKGTTTIIKPARAPQTGPSGSTVPVTPSPTGGSTVAAPSGVDPDPGTGPALPASGQPPTAGDTAATDTPGNTTLEQIGTHALGTSMGAIGGAVAGAIAGIAAGPVGSLAGAIAGGIGGGVLGSGAGTPPLTGPVEKTQPAEPDGEAPDGQPGAAQSPADPAAKRS